MKVPARFSMTPTAKPPATAPPGLDSPPRTAPAKPYNSTPNIMFGSRNTIGAISMPATAPTAADMPQPSAIIHPTRIPTRRADSGLVAAARIASPRREPRQRDPDHAGFVGANQALAKQRRHAERRRKRFDVEIPDLAGGTVEDTVESDKGGQLAQNRRVVDRPEQDPIDGDAAEEGERHGGDKCGPVRPTPLDHLPGEKGREHRHLALREIEVIDRLINLHDGECHRRIDRARRQSRQHL